MDNKSYEIEAIKPFSESLIWQLNRDYYNKEGIGAWREGEVPHQLTSNSMVGKTYAQLIFAFLKDLATQGQTSEKVYIMELGAGHGRLAFHILQHLELLIGQVEVKLPPYCYVLSDIVEENLNFFLTHHQFQSYLKKGSLDVAYFDAIKSNEILLRHTGNKISSQHLNQPLLAIANYFFDSIPNDLFYFENKNIYACSASLESNQNIEETGGEILLKDIEITYHKKLLKAPFYEEVFLNEILEGYRDVVFNTHLFFPHKGIQCIHNLNQLSKKGLMVISMDKGFHEIRDLENKKEPEMITHGSMSFWVNYHALGQYCKKLKGTSFFPDSSNFHLELGCLLLLPDSKLFTKTETAYQHAVNDFGPDDFNSLKKFTYSNIRKVSLIELLAMLRLSAFDSSFFIKILSRLKQVSQQISFNERKRLAQAMHQTWAMYFTLKESDDLAFEIGGLFYSLGFYEEALDYFQFSIDIYGHTADGYYNRALCYYQLRKDVLFLKTVKEAWEAFPSYKKFEYLNNLDLAAV